MTAINMHDDIFDDIKQFQFFQKEPGLLKIKIIPKVSYNNDSRKKIKVGLENKLGNDFKLEIEEVDCLEYTNLNKYTFVKQELLN